MTAVPSSSGSPLPDTFPLTALVTGAGKRIGRAVALDLAEQGFAVAAHYNSSATEAESLVAEITAKGGKACALQADLSKEEDVVQLMPQAQEALGPIGLLVNNASTFELDKWDTADRDSWDRHIEPNLRAPFVLTQALAKALPEDRQGMVLNILDERVWNLTPFFVSYTVSKAGLWALTQTMALALAPRIRVNGIGPGPTLPSIHQTQEQFDNQALAMPLQRGTSPQEICEALRYILRAKAMTGQMIALDGGQHLAWAQSDQPDPRFL
ncbi:SDR family oxidoreductase [Rhodovibrionaceae bacterium A322]